MSGRIGARGYVYQAIIAVLKCLETEVWDEIKVEPLTANDKVDIIMKKSGIIVKAIQVKSSGKKFEKPSIETWINEMVNDIEAVKYELVLVGEHYTGPAWEYVESINSNECNISIVKIKLNEDILLDKVKAEIRKFFQMYSASKKANILDVENITKYLFADLMLISTNEKFYNKDDLIMMLERNMVNCKERKARVVYFFQRIILFIGLVLWLYLSYTTASKSLCNLICVTISDVFVLTIWAIMKYSDYYYWNAPPEEPRIYYSARKYGLECEFLDVQIFQDNIYYKQVIWIKNIQKNIIPYVKGNIEFYSHNRKVYEVPFEQHNIQSEKSVKIDDISDEFDRNYFEKTSWNEVYLDIEKMKTESGKARSWKGIIIIFYPLPALKPIRYIKFGIIRVFPYELSWLYENILSKIWDWFKLSMTVSLRGYHKYDLGKHIRIRALECTKMLIWRVLGGLMLCAMLGVIAFTCIGQFLIVCNLFKMLL